MIKKNKMKFYSFRGIFDKMKESSKRQRSKGFSLIEVLVGVFLVGFALLGMAQLFTYSVMNNTRAGRIANATFLAQQQIDLIRNLTSAEIAILNANNVFPFGDGTTMSTDELININLDGTVDFRRITDLQASGVSWNVRVLVFPGDQAGVSDAALIANPDQYRVQADIRAFIK